MRKRYFLVVATTSILLSACLVESESEVVPALEPVGAVAQAASSGIIRCTFGSLFPCLGNEVQVGSLCLARCPYYNPSHPFCDNAAECIVPNPQAKITASPNVVEVSAGALGTTKICWDTEFQTYPVWIKVSANGASEQLFTKESDSGKECEFAPWIQPGGSYVFSIQTQKSGGAVLASTTVHGVETEPPVDDPPGGPQLPECLWNPSIICP